MIILMGGGESMRGLCADVNENRFVNIFSRSPFSLVAPTFWSFFDMIANHL
jgi:hypothetical protein